MTDVELTRQIAIAFNSCQTRHVLRSRQDFNFEDFQTTAQLITSSRTNESSLKLTKLFLDNFFSSQISSEYHHFTNIDALKNILHTKTIWLTSVRKRFNEGEFVPFYEDHGMTGFEINQSLRNDLVNNCFYLSLTHKNIDPNNEQALWQGFSAGNGAKIIFNFTNVQTHLRKIYYPDKNQKGIPLLADFINIASTYRRHLAFDGLSTVGFFYLRNSLSYEEEYRLLIKRDLGEHYRLQFGQHNSSNHEYVVLPLFAEQPIKIKIDGIVLENAASEPEIRDLLKTDPRFSNVKIEILK